MTRAKDGWKAKLHLGGNPVDLSGTTPLYRGVSMDKLQKALKSAVAAVSCCMLVLI